MAYLIASGVEFPVELMGIIVFLAIVACSVGGFFAAVEWIERRRKG